MPPRKNVQDTHIDEQLAMLHGALLDIMIVMNQAQRDDELMAAAGIRLDRALFPLLVGIGRFGPIGVVDLADRSGRDYTTVSRQVSRLEESGLIERRENATDKRVREVLITGQGKAITDRVDAARRKLGRAALADWEPWDIEGLARLTRRFADAIKDRSP